MQDVQFQSTRSSRSGTPPATPSRPSSRFQSTRSSRSGTSTSRTGCCISCYFNPPAPRGAGPAWPLPRGRSPGHFNPPAPRGAGQGSRPPSVYPASHFNPPAPRGAGRDGGEDGEEPFPISIHPLLAERDRLRQDYQRGESNFNPPAPRGAGPRNISMCLTWIPGTHNYGIRYFPASGVANNGVTSRSRYICSCFFRTSP